MKEGDRVFTLEGLRVVECDVVRDLSLNAPLYELQDIHCRSFSGCYLKKPEDIYTEEGPAVEAAIALARDKLTHAELDLRVAKAGRRWAAKWLKDLEKRAQQLKHKETK